MLFNSLSFAVFFPIITVLYFLLPHRVRWLWLLVASCYFYIYFRPIYIFILGFTILIDYIAGRLIENAQGKQRKTFLIVSLVANVAVLCFFKYADFAIATASQLSQWIGHPVSLYPLEILLPIGLSFHTFQSMSYTIEVYRGRQKAEHRLGIFALFVMFYPQLVAGPIERPQNLLHQFDEIHNWSWARAQDGLGLMAWGIFKKMAVADALAPFVNSVYSAPEIAGAGALTLATILFAFQIYCDFSGYSDIAIGSAHVMGFRLMDNFNRPYAAQSIAEFWTRWHISLSTWFKDYVYIPLGGARVPQWRWVRNILVTFLLSGLWHGANWTFLVWGGINGLFLIAGRWTQAIQKNWSPLIHVLLTFTMICVSWIFFRSESIQEALYIIKTIFTELFNPNQWTVPLKIALSSTSPWLLMTGLLSLSVMEIVHWKIRHIGMKHFFTKVQPITKAWIVAAVSLCLMFLLVGVLQTGERPHSAFIYFQF